jgi:hypothetical protein
VRDESRGSLNSSGASANPDHHQTRSCPGSVTLETASPACCGHDFRTKSLGESAEKSLCFGLGCIAFVSLNSWMNMKASIDEEKLIAEPIAFRKFSLADAMLLIAGLSIVL